MTVPVQVLYVYSDPAGVDRLEGALSRAGGEYRVEHAASAEDALDMFAIRPYDCLVAEYDMPGTSGLELLETVREEYPDLPFVLFTDSGSEAVASAAISAGVTEYIRRDASSEPYDQLARTLADVVERARTPRIRRGSPDSTGAGNHAADDTGHHTADDTGHHTAGTEQSEHERELEALNQRLDTVVSTAPVVLFALDSDGTFTLSEGAGLQKLDLDPGEAIGESVYELYEDESLLGDIERALAGEQVSSVHALDGVQFEVTYQPVFEGGEVSEVIGVAIDITERRERERTLTALHAAAREIGRSEDEATVYETLIETAERVLEFDLVTVDVERDGALVQEAWTSDPEETDYYERTSLADDDTFAVRAYNRQETIVVDDIRASELTPADPEYRSGLTVPIGEFGVLQAAAREPGAFDEHDREFAELLVDHARVKLTQLQGERALRERTEELERKNQRLDQFTSVVSHDLRNPLNALELSVEMAEETADADHFERSYRIIDRMNRLLEDLLTLARKGQTIAEPEPVALDTALEEVWATLETESATLTVETTQTLRADRSRLKQLLENLLRNAVEHGSTSSRTESDDAVEHAEHDVTVTVGDLDGGFYVADSGPGIPEEERDAVFEMGHTTATENTGFGLAIVAEIADAHGWELAITESADGGTRFEITDVEPAS